MFANAHAPPPNKTDGMHSWRPTSTALLSFHMQLPSPLVLAPAPCYFVLLVHGVKGLRICEGHASFAPPPLFLESEHLAFLDK